MGVVQQAVLLITIAVCANSKPVIFRLEDVQDYYNSGAQVDIIDTFVAASAHLCAGVIGNRSFIGNDASLMKALTSLVNAGGEIYNHGDDATTLFNVASLESQKAHILNANTVIRQTLNFEPKTFCPHQNRWNDDTVTVLKDLDMWVLSTSLTGGGAGVGMTPAQCQSQCLTSDPIFLPENATTGSYNQSVRLWQPLPVDRIMADVEAQVNMYGFAVVMLHPEEFTAANTVDGKAFSLEDLQTLIKRVAANSEYEITTFSEAASKVAPLKYRIPNRNKMINYQLPWPANFASNHTLQDTMLAVVDMFIKAGVKLGVGVAGEAILSPAAHLTSSLRCLVSSGAGEVYIQWQPLDSTTKTEKGCLGQELAVAGEGRYCCLCGQGTGDQCTGFSGCQDWRGTGPCCCGDTCAADKKGCSACYKLANLKSAAATRLVELNVTEQQQWMKTANDNIRDVLGYQPRTLNSPTANAATVTAASNLGLWAITSPVYNNYTWKINQSVVESGAIVSATPHSGITFDSIASTGSDTLSVQLNVEQLITSTQREALLALITKVQKFYPNTGTMRKFATRKLTLAKDSSGTDESSSSVYSATGMVPSFLKHDSCLKFHASSSGSDSDSSSSSSSKPKTISSLSAVSSHAYYLGCPPDKDIEVCQEDILRSPYQYIIFSFVNGRTLDSIPPVSYVNGHCTKDDLSSISRSTGIQNTMCLDPFDLILNFKNKGLTNEFAYKLRRAGKKVLASFGGGDNGETLVAVPRIFTKLWELAETDSTVAARWAATVADFLSGKNEELVVFDGLDFDNEESHQTENCDINCVASQAAKGKETDVCCYSHPPWQLPLNISELMTEASGIKFLAELTVEVRKAIGPEKEFVVAVQPAYFAPPVQNPSLPCPRYTGSTTQPCGFPLPAALTTIRTYNSYMHLFTEYPEALAAMNGMVCMLYPDSSLNAWSDGQETPGTLGGDTLTRFNKKLYNNETRKYNVGLIADNIGTFEFAVAQSKGGATIRLLTTNIILAIQTTDLTQESAYIEPVAFNEMLEGTGQEFMGMALWKYYPPTANNDASCKLEVFLGNELATKRQKEGYPSNETLPCLFYSPSCGGCEIDTRPYVSPIFMIIMWSIAICFFIAIAFELFIFPYARSRGVILRSPRVVHSCRMLFGYHVRGTRLYEGKEANKGNDGEGDLLGRVRAMTMKKKDTDGEWTSATSTRDWWGNDDVIDVTVIGGFRQNNTFFDLNSSRDGEDTVNLDLTDVKEQIASITTDMNNGNSTRESEREDLITCLEGKLVSEDEARESLNMAEKQAVSHLEMAVSQEQRGQYKAALASYKSSALNFAKMPTPVMRAKQEFVQGCADTLQSIVQRQEKTKLSRIKTFCSALSSRYIGEDHSTPTDRDTAGRILEPLSVVMHKPLLYMVSDLSDLNGSDMDGAGASELLLAHKLRNPALIKNRQYQYRSYKACLVGNEIVPWMLKNNLASSEQECIKKVQGLIDAGLLHHVHDDHGFKNEFLFYRFHADEEDENRSSSGRMASTYTAVMTKEPSQFKAEGNTLAVQRSGHDIKVMITVTMYNEDASELSETFLKIARNVQYVQRHGEMFSTPEFKNMGNNTWKHFVTTLVSDGRQKMDPTTLELLESMGLVSEEAMRVANLGDDRTQLHLFEGQTQLVRGRESKKGKSGRMALEMPMQTQIAIKEHNAGKLNSHLWAFRGLARAMSPKYVVLVDVGTKPTPSAIAKLLISMENNRQVGGCCGEIAVDHPFEFIFNPVVAAQHFEYKVSNFMDKTMESVFGFITVLPGAFSAYRLEAIEGKPLEAYFKSLTSNTKDLGAFQGNMYLAEDRILVFELLSKQDCNWTMSYVNGAVARTDVPTDLVDLIKQRRRWLNGSLFALMYSLINFNRFYFESGHSLLRKCWITIQYLYMCFNMLLVTILPAMFYLVIYYILVVKLNTEADKLIPPQYTFSIQSVSIFTVLVNYALLVSWVVQVCIGLGNKPQQMTVVYHVIAVVYALAMAFTTVTLVACMLSSDSLLANTRAVILLLGGGILLPITSAIFHLEVHHILATYVQYLLMLPSLVWMLGIYAFCNVHDLSWGTKGAETSGHGGGGGSGGGGGGGTVATLLASMKAKEEAAKAAQKETDETTAAFQIFRSKLLVSWMVVNVLMVVFTKVVDPDGEMFILLLVYIVSGINLFRFIGSTLFLLIKPIQHCWSTPVETSLAYEMTTMHKNANGNGKPSPTSNIDQATMKRLLGLVDKIRTESGLVADKSYRLKTYRQVLVGSECVDWMLKMGIAQDETGAFNPGVNDDSNVNGSHQNSTNSKHAQPLGKSGGQTATPPRAHRNLQQQLSVGMGVDKSVNVAGNNPMQNGRDDANEDDGTVKRSRCIRQMQELIDAKLLHHVSDDHDFKSGYLFYRFYVDEQAVSTKKKSKKDGNGGSAQSVHHL